MRWSYLLLVSPDNHNKFYRLEEHASNLTVSYGRVGATPIKREYPKDLYDTLYEQKIASGYKDVSNLYEAAEEKPFKPISDKAVREFFSLIEAYSSQVIKENYQVHYDLVTAKMVMEAEEILDSIQEGSSFQEVNAKLIHLFEVIPRKMERVSDYLINANTPLADILDRERDLLDVMKARVTQREVFSANQTILESLGLTISLVSDEKELAQIRTHLSAESEGRMVRAFRIRNKKTDDRFFKYMEKEGYESKDIHYLYHGSRNENWYGLISKGALLNPKAKITGKMFGNGIYFANRAKKSIGYTSLSDAFWTRETSDRGFLAVYKVLYKNPKHVESPMQYTKRSLNGNDAVFAHKGKYLKNDEIVIYDERQCTLQYVIEVS